ncbi:MAG: threonine ammonia-lyase [Butyricicoccus sp.]
MLELKDFEAAADRLKNVIHNIPLSTSCTFSAMTGAEVYLKYENQQKTGSFKVRGAYNKIMKRFAEGGLHAVVASSAGNHAQGVAFAATAAGVKSTIVMRVPRRSPSATQGYGAEVVLAGNIYDEAYAKACEICEETGAEFIHPFDDEDVMAGQGTIALEILRDLPGVDMIFVPAGGGGLISGVAACAKQINPRIQIIGVQAEGAPAIANSFRTGERTPSDTVHTIADGIAVKTPGEKTFEYIKKYVDRVVTVSDDEIASAVLLLLERCKQVVETSGAAPLAAVLNNKVDVKGKKVVCVLSGGNIDVSFIHKIVEKGLITRCRQLKFSVLMPDAPGALEHFSHIVAQQNANIILFQHDRVQTDLEIGEAIIHVVCEVGGVDHAKRLIDTLTDDGYKVFTSQI